QLTLLTGKPRTIDKLPELTPWRIKPFSDQDGGISGVVKDQSESSLPGVRVKLTLHNVPLKETVTDNFGHYAIWGVASGSYDIEFSLPGFNHYKIRKVRIRRANIVEVNATLRVAAISESIVVRAEPDSYIPMDMLKTAVPVTTELAITKKHLIRKRITLLSQTDSPRDFLVLEANLDMKTDYLTIPVLDKAAYLTATLTNDSAHTFRKGFVNTILQNEFVGKSLLPYMGPGQSVVVPVAEDKAIEVKRTLSFSNRETRGFAKKVQVDTYDYKIEILNRHSNTVHVVARDQVPVSVDESVQVKLLQIEPAIKNPENRDGIMEWQLEIPSGKSSEITYRYEIIYPVGTRINR
ncbi:MAG: mucoidy inhibitor MuiA family protein, partial [Holophagae bacterium]|nr:mucoidy inhibitor MuiA family protein [Holophagae bacterium]